MDNLDYPFNFVTVMLMLMLMLMVTWITPSNPALPNPKSFRCFRANLQMRDKEV